MRRPCILVIDHEFPGTISTRKLVIETAKFNVITAYSSHEGIETLERFPNVDAVVLNAGNHDIPCEELVLQMKQLLPALPIIVTSDSGQEDCGKGDHAVRSFEPASLLEKLRSLFPGEDGEIRQAEKKLARKEER
jgi:DNA-binding NtrC family response regulator